MGTTLSFMFSWMLLDLVTHGLIKVQTLVHFGPLVVLLCIFWFEMWLVPFGGIPCQAISPTLPTGRLGRSKMTEYIGNLVLDNTMCIEEDGVHELFDLKSFLNTVL